MKTILSQIPDFLLSFTEAAAVYRVLYECDARTDAAEELFLALDRWDDDNDNQLWEAAGL